MQSAGDAREWLKGAIVTPTDKLFDNATPAQFVAAVVSSIPLLPARELPDLEAVLRRAVRGPRGEELVSQEVHGLQFIEHVRGACGSDSDALRSSAMAILREVALTPHGAAAMLRDEETLGVVCHAMQDDVVGIWASAKAVLVHLCHTAQGLRVVCGGLVQSRLRAACDGSSQTLLRVLELVLEACQQCDGALEAFAPHGWFRDVKAVLDDKEDVLVQMNAFELVLAVARGTSPHSLPTLLHMFHHCSLASSITDAVAMKDSFVLPQALLLAGVACANSKQAGDEIVRLLDEAGVSASVVEHVTNAHPDKHILAGALYCVGGMVQPLQGQQALLARNVDKHVARFVHSSEPLVRLAALSTATSFFRALPEDQSEKMFEEIGASKRQGTVVLLVGLCKLVDAELQDQVYTVLETVAELGWGVRVLARGGGPDFLTWLMDRSTDHRKEGKERKFRIAQALMANARVQEDMDTQWRQKLRVFQLQGAFWQPSAAAVAAEQA